MAIPTALRAFCCHRQRGKGPVEHLQGSGLFSVQWSHIIIIHGVSIFSVSKSKMALSQAKLLFHEILFGLFAFFLVDTDIQNKGGEAFKNTLHHQSNRGIGLIIIDKFWWWVEAFRFPQSWTEVGARAGSWLIKSTHNLPNKTPCTKQSPYKIIGLFAYIHTDTSSEESDQRRITVGYLSRMYKEGGWGEVWGEVRGEGDLRKMQASIFLELHIALWFWYIRLMNIDTCVSCKIGYQSVFFQFVMGGCHWNVQHWPRFGVLWQMFSMNANRVWIHERSKDLGLGLVDYGLRDICLKGINHYDKCGFSWIEFCETKLPCLVNSGSLDKCRIDWWSLITQRCGNSKISDDIPIICEPAILGD